MKSLQQAKYDLVLENIKQVMLQKGIETLKISDIAKEINVGEATIYRYFGTKLNLVIQVGISLWKEIYIELSQKTKKENGYDSIADFFHFFIEGYQKKQQAFSFLDQFDSYVIHEHASQEALKAYDEVLTEIKQIFDELFLQGQKDFSINSHICRDTYYYTTTHMILGICKKLSSGGNILPSDEIIKDITQIELALDMCLQYIKRKRD